MLIATPPHTHRAHSCSTRKRLRSPPFCPQRRNLRIPMKFRPRRARGALGSFTSIATARAMVLMSDSHSTCDLEGLCRNIRSLTTQLAEHSIARQDAAYATPKRIRAKGLCIYGIFAEPLHLVQVREGSPGVEGILPLLLTDAMSKHVQVVSLAHPLNPIDH